ncbi:MAG: 3'(2'),5'-bisphosphate nucleotidase CysQ [Alphaproteobacteria bacterium]|nr:3'(2'),5'-bisphosphate nucleotidase CysQ [Alphaproteobacteria bacterium]
MESSAPKKPDAKALLGPVEEIARQAGAAIMRYYNGEAETGITVKSDGSEVTAADLAAEAVILPALKNLAPDIPVVSEERVANGETPDVSGGTFWTVDPLDGTKEFINRTGAFVVAISLVVDDKPVLGVIYHPAMDLMYSAAGAGTATKTGKDGKRTPIGKTQPDGDDEGLRVLVNEPHANVRHIKGWLSEQFGRAARIDPKSGILRACQVAEGLADMAVYESNKHDGRTNWWDIAPGHAVIEAAGGRVETLDGAPLVYKDADLRVPPHAAFAPHCKKKPSGEARPRP